MHDPTSGGQAKPRQTRLHAYPVQDHVQLQGNREESQVFNASNT
jgi:hypothetical protein